MQPTCSYPSGHTVSDTTISRRCGPRIQTTTSKAVARRCRSSSSKRTRASSRRSTRDGQWRPAARAAGSPRAECRAARADLQEARGAGFLRARRDAVRGMAARQPLRRSRAAARDPAEPSAEVLRGAADADERDAGAAIRASTCSRATSSRTPPAVSIRSRCAGSPTRIRTSRRSRSASSGPFRSCCGSRWSRTSAASRCRRSGRGRSARPRGQFASELLGIPRKGAAAPPAHRQGVVHVSRRDPSQPARSVGRVDRGVAVAADQTDRARASRPDEVLRIEQQREAIDQLSIANIINTMRVLSALDWPTFVEAVSRVERILRRDPAGAYADMDRADARSISQVGRAAVAAIGYRRAGGRRTRHRRRGDGRSASGPHADRAHHVGYYLISRGRFELERARRLHADRQRADRAAGVQAPRDRISRHAAR